MQLLLMYGLLGLCAIVNGNAEEQQPKLVVGGWKTVDVNNEAVQKLAHFSLSKLEGTAGSDDKLNLEEVIEAEKQVVAGSLFRLKLKVADPQGASKICDVKLLVQPWISEDPTVTDASCENKPLSRK